MNRRAFFSMLPGMSCLLPIVERVAARERIVDALTRLFSSKEPESTPRYSRARVIGMYDSKRSLYLLEKCWGPLDKPMGTGEFFLAATPIQSRIPYGSFVRVDVAQALIVDWYIGKEST